jgi:beta-carotene 3-hydroxylase
MTLLANTLIVLTTVVAMELVARYSHEYIMHGWGWGWHRSHHEVREHVFERNDLYAVVFAVPSVLLIYFGARYEHWMVWVGTGMTIYGFLYFVVHDGLVHHRWPFRLIPKGRYLKRLVQAHRLHHAVRTRSGCVSFGFLYAEPVDRLRAELRRLHGGPPEAAKRPLDARGAE